MTGREYDGKREDSEGESPGERRRGGKLARPWNVECFGIVEFLWETNGLVVAHSGANDNERSERRARTLEFGEERESKVQDKRERSREEGVQGGEGRKTKRTGQTGSGVEKTGAAGRLGPLALTGTWAGGVHGRQRSYSGRQQGNSGHWDQTIACKGRSMYL
ncbi:hypothetical protein MHUMG1_08540 [Metarhizium humberi]|uniref:Uncharacterized protein n=1 Tax=Metarhizium humberi TaxID=2596975 RepID=A0A9P8S461_9HYPO|nr:hypothetical protein MHUMG1_08540 [Metarhizium humberi]